MFKRKLHYDTVISYEDSDMDLNSFIEHRTKLGEREDVSKRLGLQDFEILARFERGESILKANTFTLFLLIANLHPNYTLCKQTTRKGKARRATPLLIKAPGTGIKRKEKRENVKKMTKKLFTQQNMADLINLTNKTLISNYEKEVKHPSIQTWTIFLLATSQHPFYYLQPKGLSK